MARITTECPQCGRVELGPDDVTLVVSPRTGAAWYQFDCLGCVEQVVKPASSPVISALSRVGIDIQTVPDEVLEHYRAEDREPLRVDHLLDLMLWLRRHDSLADLPVEVAPALEA